MLRTLTRRCRQLRQRQTPHERRLWGYLRASRLHHLKFYRQYSIEPYIVDFFCPEKRVVIELDGGGHAECAQEELDKVRDQSMQARGYRILRIWNSDLAKDIEPVLQMILDFCFEVDSPPLPSAFQAADLSPKGEGNVPIYRNI